MEQSPLGSESRSPTQQINNSISGRSLPHNKAKQCLFVFLLTQQETTGDYWAFMSILGAMMVTGSKLEGISYYSKNNICPVALVDICLFFNHSFNPNLFFLFFGGKTTCCFDALLRLFWLQLQKNSQRGKMKMC